MVLVDTSVWIDHLRVGNARLTALLNEGGVACHPFIIGELACGSLKNRTEILSLLQALPSATVVGHEEVMRFIGDRGLMNRGIGYIDVHLLASAMLSAIPIWSFDKKLNDTSKEFGIDFKKEERG